MDDLNEQSIGTLQIKVYPNPNNGNFTVKFHLKESGETKISLSSFEGKKIDELVLKNLHIGENIYLPKIKNSDLNGIYILTIETPYETATQKIVIHQ